MAKYKAIYTKIWDDPDFQDYEPDVKLMFIYLCTNQLTTESGIYPITCKTIANDLGISLETVSKRLENGYIKNVFYDKANKCIFVKNLRRYNPGGSPNLIAKSIAEDYRNSNKCTDFWQLFKETYPIEAQNMDIELEKESSKEKENDSDNSKVSNSISSSSNSILTLQNSSETVDKPLEDNDEKDLYKYFEEKICSLNGHEKDFNEMINEIHNEIIVKAIDQTYEYKGHTFDYFLKVLDSVQQKFTVRFGRVVKIEKRSR